MPSNIFSTEAEPTGLIERTPANYSILASAFEIQVTSEQDWQAIDEGIIARRAQILGIDAPDTETRLALIESRYVVEAAGYYGVPIEDRTEAEIWAIVTQARRVNRAGMNFFELQDDIAREQTARALQLNKFLATWEEIEAECDALGLQL